MTTLSRAGRELRIIAKGTKTPRETKPQGRAYWSAERLEALRLSDSRTAQAIRLHLAGGLTQADACRQAEVLPGTLRRALTKVRRAARVCPTCGHPIAPGPGSETPQSGPGPHP